MSRDPQAYSKVIERSRRFLIELRGVVAFGGQNLATINKILDVAMAERPSPARSENKAIGPG